MDELEQNLAASKVACEVKENEAAAQLEQMKMLAIDAILHALAELMEKFKAGQKSEWDPNYEIGVWHD